MDVFLPWDFIFGNLCYVIFRCKYCCKFFFLYIILVDDIFIGLGLHITQSDRKRSALFIIQNCRLSWWLDCGGLDPWTSFCFRLVVLLGSGGPRLLLNSFPGPCRVHKFPKSISKLNGWNPRVQYYICDTFCMLCIMYRFSTPTIVICKSSDRGLKLTNTTTFYLLSTSLAGNDVDGIRIL